MLLTSLTTYSEQNIHIIIKTNKVVTMVQRQHNTLTGRHFMDRLNAGNVEKLTVSNGRPFQMFMTRSEKKL